MIMLRTPALICLALASAAAQEFDVVSVKPVTPDSRGYSVYCRGGPGSPDPGLYNCINMSLSNLITLAYKINHYQLAAPDWAQSTMFEIHARVPEGATKDDLPLMLQKMLAERFKLVVHHETRDLQKYELTVAKNGPKFQEAAPPPPPKEDGADAPKPAGRGGPLKLGADGYPDLRGFGMAIMNGRARTHDPQMTMQRLASQLGAQLASPVTDATGLTGKYDISIFWVTGSRGAAPPGADSSPAPAEDPGPTLIQAVQQQLGLRLESKKGPVDFIVVDHAEQKPSEN
jgi:uncharacterized protein (TIGR03435 family)